MYTVVSFENYLQLLINTVILILKYMYVYSRTISQLYMFCQRISWDIEDHSRFGLSFLKESILFYVSTGLWWDLLTVVKYSRMCVHILPNQQSCCRADATLSWLGHACYGTKLHHLANEQACYKRRLIVDFSLHISWVQLKGWCNQDFGQINSSNYLPSVCFSSKS